MVGYRRIYHVHVRDKLVCHTLKEKCLPAAAKALEGDMENWRKFGRHSTKASIAWRSTRRGIGAHHQVQKVQDI
jgi:hypothetical protein